MGFLDLSTSASAKKHVDFNDARYQLADKLKWNGKQAVRSTFTLYDNKEENKVAVQEISAAYALSDKRLPMGELLNKMVDMIWDMEDGRLDSEKDAVYAWKYSMALIMMYEDKIKRQEPLSTFDNGLKTSVINSKIFINRYPGKYTTRTNFFDQKVKEAFTADIVDTFKDLALPGIHEAAIKQSREVASRHNNPILDRIVQWAVENYKCEVDSFFEVKEDGDTHLFFSTNTIILHLRNGYDMSIIGSAGTDHDDKFAISILDTQNISIAQHDEKISQSELKDALSQASAREKIDPLTKLLKMEKDKNSILKQQYDILIDIRPMVPADVLELQAAESVVGANYIWGCKQFREKHEDLPPDFKLEDVKLPKVEWEEDTSLSNREQQALVDDYDTIANAMTTKRVDAAEVENDAKSMIADAVGLKSDSDEYKQNAVKRVEQVSLEAQDKPHNAEELLHASVIPKDLFETIPQQKKVEDKKFGDPASSEFKMPTLTLGQISTATNGSSQKKEQEFDTAATLLPGFIPMKQQDDKSAEPSVTKDAQPVPIFHETNLWKEPTTTVTPKVEEKPQPSGPQKKPDLLFDDLDDLFA